MTHVVFDKSVWDDEHNIEVTELVCCETHLFFDCSFQYSLKVFCAHCGGISARSIEVTVFDWPANYELRGSMQS